MWSQALKNKEFARDHRTWSMEEKEVMHVSPELHCSVVTTVFPLLPCCYMGCKITLSIADLTYSKLTRCFLGKFSCAEKKCSNIYRIAKPKHSWPFLLPRLKQQLIFYFFQILVTLANVTAYVNVPRCLGANCTARTGIAKILMMCCCLKGIHVVRRFEGQGIICTLHWAFHLLAKACLTGMGCTSWAQHFFQIPNILS